MHIAKAKNKMSKAYYIKASARKMEHRGGPSGLGGGTGFEINLSGLAGTETDSSGLAGIVTYLSGLVGIVTDLSGLAGMELDLSGLAGTVMDLSGLVTDLSGFGRRVLEQIYQELLGQ